MSIKDDRVDLSVAVGGTTAGPEQRIVWELATRLSRTRFRTQAWLAAGAAMNPLAEALASVEIPVKRLAGTGWRGFLDLRVQLKRQHPTLLHLHHPFGEARRWSLGLLEASGDARLVITQPALEPRADGSARAIDRRIAARADAVLVSSGSLADHLVRDLGVERSRVRTLAEGLDLPDPEEEKEQIRRDRGFLGGGPFRPIWLCPERLESDRGHETLLRALARVRDQGLPFLFVWTGEGTRRSEIEERARTLGLAERVRFTAGQRPSRSLAAAADLVVFPGRGEERGPEVLEAMARGRIVVASACGAASELIENGWTGRLVPADDEAELAATLETLARHPDAARRMGAAAAQRVLETHAWPRVIESIEAVYDEVLGFATFVPDSAQVSPSKR